MNKNANRELSRVEIAFAFLGVAILVVPLIFVTVFGDNKYIQFVLGGWRIFLFWAVAIPACYVLEKKFNPKIRHFWPAPDADR